jgi:hypothetical protein
MGDFLPTALVNKHTHDRGIFQAIFVILQILYLQVLESCMYHISQGQISCIMVREPTDEI